MERRNNFDALRLVAAASVIFSHSFLLSQGREDTEPLMRLTGGQAIFGVVGVFVFFVLSGFLVTQSFETTLSPLRFLAKRALRIYPGYAVCLLLCTFALGPLISALPLRDYLASVGTWDFLLSNLAMNVEHNGLPGVRFTGFAIGGIVDGPLWSLPCEMVMYLLVLALGVLRLIRLAVLLPLLALGLACLWLDTAQSAYFIGAVGWLLGFFVAGMILYKLRFTRLFDRRLALPALIAMAASVPFHLFILLFPLFGAWLIIWLALEPRLPVIPAARFGDLSYGLYIYGWPVQQTLLHVSGGRLLWWQLFPLALALAAAIAWLSWHLVEQPALRLKPSNAAPEAPETAAASLAAPHR
ncbi:MAG TPA: acyltransferase [Stellaceae bacterium]|nr:acyltransferase [Stellaceae bacterium]